MESVDVLQHKVVLAGRIHVSGYDRTSSTGKRVRVSSYFRSPGKMSMGELFEALDFFDAEIPKQTNPIEAVRYKNQRKAVYNKLRSSMTEEHIRAFRSVKRPARKEPSPSDDLKSVQEAWGDSEDIPEAFEEVDDFSHYGNANDAVVRVRLNDKDYVVKRSYRADNDNELRAGKVAEALGFPFGAALLQSDGGNSWIAMPFIDGQHGTHKKPDEAENADDMALLDFLIGNTDRHSGNYIWQGDKVVPIDHGHSDPGIYGATDRPSLVEALGKLDSGPDESSDFLVREFFEIEVDRMFGKFLPRIFLPSELVGQPPKFPNPEDGLDMDMAQVAAKTDKLIARIQQAMEQTKELELGDSWETEISVRLRLLLYLLESRRKALG